ARDRYFWRQVERALGERVPARAEFDARPRHLTADEWLVAAPGGIARGLRQAWSTIARKARGAVRRIGRVRGRSAGTSCSLATRSATGKGSPSTKGGCPGCRPVLPT